MYSLGHVAMACVMHRDLKTRKKWFSIKKKRFKFIQKSEYFMRAGGSASSTLNYERVKYLWIT